MHERLDVPYSADGSDDLQRYDLFLPDANGPVPLIAIIHGGGWDHGHRRQWHPVARHLCARGYACANLGYRFAPTHRYPVQTEDIAQALTAIVAQASALSIDPQRIVMLGSSAGGYLALAATPPAGTRIRGVIAYCPVVRLDDRKGHVRNFLGGTEAEMPARYREADLLHRMPAPSPPILYLQGDVDPTTPVSDAGAFVAALTTRGTMVRYHLFPGIAHGFGWEVESPGQRLALPLGEEFLRDVTGGPVGPRS